MQETPFVKFWYSIKGYDPQLPEEAIKIFLPCPTVHSREDRFLSYTSTKTIYQNRLNAEADVRVQQSFINPDIKKSCKNVKQCIFFIWKNSYFSLKYVIYAQCDSFITVIFK